MDDVDLYSEIHKGLRKVLFDLSYQSGNMDWSSPEDVAAFAPRFEELLELLREHAQNEEGKAHALLRRSVLGLASQLEQDHREQRLVEDELEERFESISLPETEPATRRRLGADFHRGLNRFIAMYLEHLNIEETAANGILWAFCTEQEIIDLYWAIINDLTPQQQVQALSCMFPAMNVHERIALLARSRQALPPEAYAGLCSLAESLVAPAEWQAVMNRLDGV